MQEARHAADAAIAVGRLDVGLGIYFEANPAAMAATYMCRHKHSAMVCFFQVTRRLFAGIA